MTSISRKLIFILFLYPLVVHAQREDLQGLVRPPNLLVSYEAVSLFGADTSQGIVNIHYRIDQRFFIFLRNGLEAKPDDFVARGELLIELLNEANISAARDIRQITLKRSALPSEKDRPPDLEGAVSFGVAPGEYKIVFSLDDRGSDHSFLERIRKVRVISTRLGQFDLSTPIFAYQDSLPTSEGAPVFVPFNRGSSILFGGKGGYLFQVYRPQQSLPFTLEWKLTGRRDFPGLVDQTFSGARYVLFDGLLTLTQNENSISYSVRKPNSGWKALFVPLPLEKLDPGIFSIKLKFHSGGQSYPNEYRFQVFWPTRPVTLQSLDLAVDALRHIATEEQLDVLQSGSRQRRAKAFYEFWSTRDPDTTTAYNEMMTEYYRRVDESNRRFSNDDQGDGYKTDRGRIFILYGAPTRVERFLKPGSPPREVWTYESIKRRFIFVDQSKNGNYVLTETENL